jgi:DNA-binding Lrp family transcriptional regulator
MAGQMVDARADRIRVWRGIVRISSPALVALLGLGLHAAVQAGLAPAMSYLEDLPQPPASICLADPTERERSTDHSTLQERFEKRVRELAAKLGAEIESRSRIVKETAARGTINPAQEAAMGQAGVTAAEAEANRRLTSEQRRVAAMKKIEQTYGISQAEIDKLKQMKKEGKLEGIQGWGKAVTAERQAGAAIDPGKVTQAQKDTQETARLAQQLALISQRVGAAMSKHTERFRELAESEDQKRLMAVVKHHAHAPDMPSEAEMQDAAVREAKRRQVERDNGKKKPGDEEKAAENRYSKENCEARVSRFNQMNAAQNAYCRFLTPSYVEILRGMKTSLTAHQADYAELDRIQGEIARLQFGAKPVPEQQGLSMLIGVREYAQRLSSSYLYKLTNNKPMSAVNCGKLGF